MRVDLGVVCSQGVAVSLPPFRGAPPRFTTGSTTSTATSSETATQRWAPPAPLPARRRCLSLATPRVRHPPAPCPTGG
eukprot:1240914-Prymnesium_polylepis.1